jgi:DNA-nicking Smr family endonuclease
MKQLTEHDISEMIGGEFSPDENNTRKSVRAELHLSTRIPHKTTTTPNHATLDLHQYTEEQAWAAIMTLAQSGVRDATIITGASGILRVKFQQWATDSLFSPYIISWAPLNNGSFSVKFKKHPNT